MTAGDCTATVLIVGNRTFTCERTDGDHEVHRATLPSDGKWAEVQWTGDTSTIRPPGAKRSGA